MTCSLSTKQQLTFLGFVYKELEAKVESKETVDIKKYIQDFYNEALSKTGDKAKALTYTQILPGFMLQAYANKFNKLGGIDMDLNNLKDTIKLFEDFDEVGKYVTPIVEKDPIIEASQLAKQSAKKPKKTKDTPAQTAAKILEFMFKPQTPLSTTGQQGTKVKDLSDIYIAALIKRSINDQPTQSNIDRYREEYGARWTNIKNKEEDFYYNFFHTFTDALDNSNRDPSKMIINGHTGFKLKLVNKSQIPISKTKTSDQEYANSTPSYSPTTATAAVVADNDGNILYFDENYKVVSEEIGLPIYHNLRTIKKPINGKFELGFKEQYANPENYKYDASAIQTAQEIAKNRFVPTGKFKTLDQLKEADPALYKKYVDKAEADLQIQLKAMYDIRTYLLENPSNNILTDITSVSRGIVNIRQGQQTKWSDIDWTGSDIIPNSKNTLIATRNNPALNERQGTAYLRIPGNKSIELQKDNITNEDAEKLANLLVDDVKEIKGNREVSVSFDTKMKLFRSFSIEYSSTGKNPVQFNEATQTILVNKVDITKLTDAKDQIIKALTTPSQPKSIYNTKFGQYAFSGTDVQGNFVDFSIKENVLTEEKITLSDHIKQHSTLKVLPNEINQIVYLNGYFSFNLPDMSLPKYQPKIINIDDLKSSDPRWNKYSNEDIQRFIDSLGGNLNNVNKLLQEKGRSLEKILDSEIKNLQTTVENELIVEQDDELIRKGGQSYVYLNDKDAERFSDILDKTKEFPKQFKVTKKITKYERRDSNNPLKFSSYNEYVDYYYIKLNNNKKSNLYQVIDKATGEIIVEKARVLHLAKDSKSKIAEQYGLEFKPTKVFSANRSIAFSLYRQKPSKAKYIAQAKKYLYDALKFLNTDETNLKINLDEIESLLDSFPEEMWDYINTTYSPEDSTNVNASISLQNEIKFNLPKLGLLQEIEKITGIPLQGVSFKNYDRSGWIQKKLNYGWGEVVTIDHTLFSANKLRGLIAYYLNSKGYFKPTSSEANVRKYAEHKNIDYSELRELVFGDINKALDNISYNTTGNSDTIELSKWREAIRNYDWQSAELFSKPYENFQNTVKERITEKFKDKKLSNGISHLEYFFNSGAFNWLNINFNNISGQYYTADMETEADTGVRTKMGGIINPFEMKVYSKPKAGKNFLKEEEVFNRLAAILHEPFHALHALSYGTKEEKELRVAFDNLYKTDFGKELMNETFGSGYNKGQNVSYDTLYKEFTAFTTQIMLYPKAWINKTDLRSNDIIDFIQKIQSLQDKTYVEIVKTQQKIGTTESTITKEEQIKLSFLEKLYNYLVKALNKIIPLSKKFTNLIAASKLVEKQVIEDVFGTVEESVTKTLKLPKNVKDSKKDFLQKMDELQIAINTLMQIDSKLFSSDNITNFFTNNKYNQEISKSLASYLRSAPAISHMENFIAAENKLKQSTSEARTITYTPKGKTTQTYTIKGSKIFNASNTEVFKKDSIDRNKIFANLAVKENRAQVVEYKGVKYVVNNKNQIISSTTGKLMQWGENNGNRKAILSLITQPNIETAGTMTQTTSYGTTAGPTLTTSSQPTSEVDAEEADIERRRQEELGKLNKLKLQDLKTKIGNFSSLTETRTSLINEVNNLNLPAIDTEVLIATINYMFDNPNVNPNVDGSEYTEEQRKKYNIKLLDTDAKVNAQFKEQWAFFEYSFPKLSRKELQKIVSKNGIGDRISAQYKMALLSDIEGVSGLPDNLAQLQTDQINAKYDAQIAEVKNRETKPTQQTSEVDDTNEESINEKIARLKKEQENSNKKNPRSGKTLYRSRALPMESNPKQVLEAKNWFDNISGLKEHIDYIEMFNVVNSNGWAEFKDGAITLYQGSDSTALYHEAWHAFSQHFLSKKQKKDLYKEILRTPQGQKAVRDYAEELGKGFLNQDEAFEAVEELIAEDFRKYAMSGGKRILNGRTKRNTIFRKILNFLKKVLGKITGKTFNINKNTPQLTELFNKLYLGELNEYTPSADNVMFKKSLFKSYKKGVTRQNTKLLVDNINSVILEYIDKKNIEHGTTAYGNNFYNGDVELVEDVYAHVKNTFLNRAVEMYTEAESLIGTDKDNKIKYAKILLDAVDNFGDNIDGLMKYHIDNSDIIPSKIKDIDQESFDISDEDKVAARFDKVPNSLSLVEYSSSQVMSLVRGLKKYENGKIVYSVFGFPEMTPWQEVWKTLISTLSDNNSAPRVMKEALQKIAPLTPWVDDLLNKLGPTNSSFDSVQDLWTGFWSAFYFSHEKLYEVLINEVFSENEDGVVSASKFEVMAGYASAVFRKVEMDWRSNFKISNHANPFITDVEKLGNVLNVPAIIDKFSTSSLSSNKEKFEFITAIGIPLTENNDILNGLSDLNDIGFIYDKLVSLNKHNYQITDVISVLKDHIKIENKEGTYNYQSEATNINKILNLEAKYSGNYSNTAVMTAEGQVAYEQTQMSSFSKMIKQMNDSESLQELIAIPSMSFLDPASNDSIQASNIIKALFDSNGNRRKNIKITIDNLEGTQNMINNSFSDTSYSTSTSKADKFTRLQQDIYSLLVGGKMSLFTPGDKGTILSFNINDINTPRSNDKHLYVDLGDFGKKGSELNLGIEKTWYLMMPYLDGELKRIERIKNDPNMPALEGYTVPILNEDGTVEKAASGLSLGIFDDIFNRKKEGVRSEVLKYKSVAEIPAEIQARMMNEFNTYMTWQMQQTIDTLGRTIFIDDNLKSLTERKVGKKIENKALEKIIVAAYTANKFINNAEALVLFFGDITQYKDFDKRNSAINSTGRMFRTDEDWNDFVNEHVGRLFSDKHNGKTTNSPYTAWNGILQTAILKDNIVDSKFYGKYLEIATKAMGKEKAEKLLSPYKNMEEGDGQGWISFDTYRILSKASNRWLPEQEDLYLQILSNPETIDPLKVLEYFPARKYQYFGALAIPGIHATAFHKYSLMPLIPTVIKNKNLNKLHNMMMEQGIDYAVYKTGSKVSNLVKKGTSGGDVIYKKGEDRVIDSSLTFTKNPIYLEYLKDQLDINSHFKNKVIFSTQLRKLVEEGLAENGVPVDFKINIKDKDERKKAWAKAQIKGETTPFYEKYKTYESKIEKLVHLRMAELTNETLGKDGKADMTKLVEFINKELERQDLTEHEKEFIGVNSFGELIHDLSISPSASKIEKTLNSIVNRRLIRQMINGEALVQISSSMFEPEAPTEDDLIKYGQRELKPYLPGEVKANGEVDNTVAMEVKIALQGKFKSLIHLPYDKTSKVAVYTKREYIDGFGNVKYIKEFNQEKTLNRLNTLINSEEFLADEDNVKMITMVGVRIPVQGLNSMEFMRIKEFLPTSAGNIIVPPAEIVAKSGSDFDIDKLTIMMPSIVISGGRPQILKEHDSGLTPKATVARIEELNLLIKEARAEKKTTKTAADNKFKSLQKGNLTDELIAEKAIILDPFLEASKKLDEDIIKYTNRITKFQGQDNTIAQEEALDEAWEQLKYIEDKKDQIDDELNAAKLEFAITKKLVNSKEVSNSKESKAYVAAMANLDKLKLEQAGLSPEAIENSIMFSIKEILEMPHNFLNLITPNDTSIVKPVADARSDQRSYKDTEGVWGKTEGVSLTRNLEIAYNIYKHESNSVGKDTLGLGAVDNTFNTIFNRIGAYMNSEYTSSNHIRRATILMEHNILNGENISLSHLYDVNNEHKISDLINQLLNGWLDVAKDAWIFDLQGNKQLTPVLMFLLQAGVDFENSVDFISNPIVKKYVEEQQIVTSSWAKALGEAPRTPSLYKNRAQQNIFAALGILPEVSFINKAGRMVISGSSVYQATLERTKKNTYSDESVDFTDNIKDIAELDEATAMKDKNAIAAFLHYLELEKLAEGVRDIKMTLNYDTSRSTTLFDAQKTKADLTKLKSNDLFPPSLIDDFFKETPVGSFNVADFQLELWAPLFKIRNDSMVNNHLLDIISDFANSREMTAMFGSEEAYVEEFKNGLISKLFIDEIKNFSIKKGYKGFKVNTDKTYSDYVEVDHLDRGVSVVDGIIYIDKDVLLRQFKDNLYSETPTKVPQKGIPSIVRKTTTQKFNYFTLGLAPVDRAAFADETGESDYINFSIEREMLREMNPFSDFSKTIYFERAYRRNLAQRPKIQLDTSSQPASEVMGKVDETLDQREKRLLQVTYEELLRDMALDNTLNFWKLFKSYNNIAEQLFQIRDMHPSLKDDFSIVNDFIMSESSKKPSGKKNVSQGLKNLALRDNRVEKDMFEIYYENMVELSTGTVIPIDNINDKLENTRLNEFFSRLPLVAFLQSGLDTKNALSIMRAMPSEMIAEIIESGTTSDKFTKEYLDNYTKKFNSHNKRTNISIRKRLQDYATVPKKDPNRSLTKHDFTIDHVIPMNFKKDIFESIISGEVTSTTRAPYERSNVKEGDIIEFTNSETNRTMLVRATSNEGSLLNVDPKELVKNDAPVSGKEDYVQFSFEPLNLDETTSSGQIVEVNPANIEQLKALIKNNPDVIFALEGTETQDNMYVETLGAISKTSNMLPVITRIRASAKDKDLWSNTRVADNKEYVKNSLDAIQELYDQGKKIAFINANKGYGTYMLNKNSQGKMIDSETYKYLSAELFSRFKYSNKFSKAMTETQGLIKENQNFKEFSIIIPWNEIIEAQERLTCKT
tara:strand:- start:26196 stop:40082 length:13887 start_codon:yes stop_codon:yes gene_type:complete